jgi:hypothetical protein
MKAISVRPPWAWAIIHGGKDVENRGQPSPWRSCIGTRVAVHASRTVEWDDLEEVESITGLDDLPRLAVAQGLVLGTVRVKALHIGAGRHQGGCGAECSDWAALGQWHLVLADPEPCEPFVFRGALGRFVVPDELIGTPTKPDDDAWTRDPDVLCRIISAAIDERDWQGVEAALTLLALCDPKRAQMIVNAAEIAREASRG